MAPMTGFTILDEERQAEIEVTVDGDRVLLDAAALERATGWTLKPEGLCRDDVCVPLRERSAGAQALDLTQVAAALRRPLALDVPEGMAVLGASAEARSQRLSTLDAPDFTLPDLAGRPHTLSEHRGRKVLLLVYASW